MPKTEDSFDEQEHDSSDNEETKKGFADLLANPSYLSSTMKVCSKCVLALEPKYS
jgi:hypothetical protein